jgi:hypothetical protein
MRARSAGSTTSSSPCDDDRSRVDSVVREIVLHLAPVLLGGGVRLFGEAGAAGSSSTASPSATEQLTDLRFHVVKQAPAGSTGRQ